MMTSRWDCTRRNDLPARVCFEDHVSDEVSDPCNHRLMTMGERDSRKLARLVADVLDDAGALLERTCGLHPVPPAELDALEQREQSFVLEQRLLKHAAIHVRLGAPPTGLDVRVLWLSEVVDERRACNGRARIEERAQAIKVREFQLRLEFAWRQVTRRSVSGDEPQLVLLVAGGVERVGFGRRRSDEPFVPRRCG